ncbi:DUF3365 domain-containing protein [Shewanella sp. 202IG2-18]|uniref:Tll0287-like domain-containing protein n=1 Tax=Parashewanella hymeniacidonis TaxID=2807618 RepID=UPI001961AC40|nr:DUF3365 domain-containing protein [Parashewanella hymeniacidonis]MBM7070713.1 DUF3365 domain-containing protein [Parashewanella hymeniacidonis]
MSAIKSGGPIKGIDACNDQAAKIALANSSKQIILGRSSHKLRNPENAPEKWLVEPIKLFASGKQSQPQLLKIDDEHQGFIEPIKIQAPCLTCHGTEIAKPISEKLTQVYPEDQATGFQLNDFRGIFWVKIKK